MFGFGKKLPHQLYVIIVPPAPDADTDSRMICFVAAKNDKDALWDTMARLRAEYEVTNSGIEVTKIDPAKWEAVVLKRWPNAAKTMPTRRQIDEIVETSGFLGPYQE